MLSGWKKRSIGVIICDIGMDPIAESPSASLFFGMMALVAQFERERIAERIAEGKAAKRARGGCVGGVPFGFRKEGHGSKSILVPDEKEQQAILRAVKLSHDYRLSYARMAAKMAEEGLVGRDGKPYGPMAVTRMIERGRKRPKPDDPLRINPPQANSETEMHA